jgi:uncharacterized protein (UPF0261 family)
VARILVLATLDTKGDEAAFLAAEIRALGHEPWLVDLSLGLADGPPGDLTRAEIAAAAGSSVAELRSLPRASAMEHVARGAADLVAAQVTAGTAQAVLALGGGTGTWLATTILRTLPLGFPKLIVSTLGSRDGRTDLMVMPSVADIAGLNSVLRPILRNAAAAACGMAASLAPTERRDDRPTVALTMFGVTTRGATVARQLLEDAGYEVVVFHANGSGGAAMEDLVRQGAFVGVLDWTTSEVTDELAGGVCTAGPTRLDAAAACGIPQVVVPGAVDVINLRGEIPPRFAGRVSHLHLPGVPLIRTSVAESEAVGCWIATKLNGATGPVRVLIPAGGYSALDVAGGPFHDPPANAAFEGALRQTLRADIPVEVVPDNINDAAFAQRAVAALRELIGELARGAGAAG